MVISYLEKIKEKYQENRIDAFNRLSAFQTEYKENTELIKLLEGNQDSTFAVFTPREVTGFHRQKIQELEARQKELAHILTEVRSEISYIDNEIYEIGSVIKVAKENKEDLEKLNLNKEECLDDAGYKLALLETQENERQRIARELHDSTVQNLTSLVHKTELCLKIMDSDAIRCKLELNAVNSLLRDVINDTRNMIYDLRPMSFDDIGFDITVERFLDKLRKMTGSNISFQINGTPYAIKNVIGITLLRVIQEACHNAIKHSGASNIEVEISYGKPFLMVRVEDDGKGFETYSENVSRDDNSGFGLSMMKERIYLLSGKLSVESTPENGCCVKAFIPMEE